MLVVVPERPYPISNATNAYDGYADVVQTILDEPKRLDMGDWIITPSKVIRNVENPALRPACGWQGCFAGWSTMILPIPAPILKELVIYEWEYGGYSASNIAMVMLGAGEFYASPDGSRVNTVALGLTNQQRALREDLRELFVDGKWRWNDGEHPAEHANEVANAALALREKYADFLKTVTYPRPVLPYEEYERRYDAEHRLDDEF